MGRLRKMLRSWERSSGPERFIFTAIKAEQIFAAMAGKFGSGRIPEVWHETAPIGLVYLVDIRGWKMEGIAREIGVSSRSVRRWWRGHSQPSPINLERLKDLTATVAGIDRKQAAIDQARKMVAPGQIKTSV